MDQAFIFTIDSGGRVVAMRVVGPLGKVCRIADASAVTISKKSIADEDLISDAYWNTLLT